MRDAPAAGGARGPSEGEVLTAYHEAGHAVMAQLCGHQVTAVEILGDHEHAGTVESLRFDSEADEPGGSDAPTADIERRLRCLLAGMVAEAMVSGHEEWNESSEDLDAAVRLAMRLVDDCEAVLPLLHELRVEISEELREHWEAVTAVSDALLVRKSLNGAEIRRLLEHARGR